MLLCISTLRGVAIKLTRCVAAPPCETSIAINSIEFPLNDSTCNYVRRNQRRNIAPRHRRYCEHFATLQFLDILQLIKQMERPNMIREKNKVHKKYQSNFDLY